MGWLHSFYCLGPELPLPTSCPAQFRGPRPVQESAGHAAGGTQAQLPYEETSYLSVYKYTTPTLPPASDASRSLSLLRVQTGEVWK